MVFIAGRPINPARIGDTQAPIAAAALAAEAAGPDSTIWWVTGGEFNTGLINLTTKGFLAKQPAEVAELIAARGPLNLGGATVKVAGLGKTSRPMSPQARVWLTSFTKTLCQQWQATGCEQIDIGHCGVIAACQRPASWPSDPPLRFPAG